MVRPTDSQLELFGAGPHHVDGEPFDPVYMRLTPQFSTVHILEYGTEYGSEYGTESGSASDSGNGRRHNRHAV